MLAKKVNGYFTSSKNMGKLSDTSRNSKMSEICRRRQLGEPSSKNSVIKSQQTPINGTKSISKNQLKCVGKYFFTHVKNKNSRSLQNLCDNQKFWELKL